MSAKPCLIITAALFTVTACGTSGSTSGGPAPSTPSSSTSLREVDRLSKGAYDPARNAEADIAAALASAKADRRPVLLDFGANWCTDCALLDRTFHTDTVRRVLDGFHLVPVDVGNFDRHLDLAKKYQVNLRASGIPALVVLSETGDVRATTNDGSFDKAQTPEQVAAYLKHWR